MRRATPFWCFRVFLFFFVKFFNNLKFLEGLFGNKNAKVSNLTRGGSMGGSNVTF